MTSSRTTNFVVFFLLLVNTCHCCTRKLLNISSTTQFDTAWSPASATWYGATTGAGSVGGSCGYMNAVELPPLSNMISAVGPTLYQSDQGCGVCYEVKCSANAACSDSPVRITVTDSCPGCTYASDHFDLSGTAFGAMAKNLQADQLRNVGVLQIQYRRVECEYPGVTLALRVDAGSNPYYFAAVIEYANGDGNFKTVELQQAGDSRKWVPMQHLWGALWKLNSGSALHAPFSLRLTGAVSGQTLVVNNVIPNGWKPGQTYRSVTNFHN